MTLRELSENLGVSRRVALHLAKRLPGAKKEPVGDGKLPRWVIPDDALELIDEPAIAAARQAAQTAGRDAEDEGELAGAFARGGAGAAELQDDALALQRERLAADRAKARTARLIAEGEQERAERDLETRRKAFGDSGAGDRIGHLERDLGDLTRAVRELVTRPAPDPTAAVTALVQAVAPLVTPLLARPPVAAAVTQDPRVELLQSELSFYRTQLLEQLKTPTRATPDATLKILDNLNNFLQRSLDTNLGEILAAGQGGDGGGGTVAAVINGLAPHLDRWLPEILARFSPRAPVAAVMSPPTAAAPGAPGIQGAGTPRRSEGAVREIVDLLLVELQKPKEDRDAKGIASFLESVVVGADGASLFDILIPIARSPEAMAKFSVRNVDERLVTEQAWPGVRELLGTIRGLVDQEEPRA